MELVREYLYFRFTRRDPLPFPQYLEPKNRYVNDFWITQEGTCIYPRDMASSHLLNVLRLIHLQTQIAYMYKNINADRYILHGLQGFPQKAPTGREHSDSILYRKMWDEKRIYMHLRREAKLRGLEVQL